MTAYDYFEALKNAAKSMVRVRSPRHLLKMMTRFIDREVGVKHTTIIVFDNTFNRYVIVDSKGNKRIPIGLIRLDADNPLIKWFTRKEKSVLINKDFLSSRQVDEMLADKDLLARDPTLKVRLLKVREYMDILKAAVCVPGRFKGELIGILLLGEKLNGEDFNLEELSFFQTLASDASMTIKRFEFEDDLKRKYTELAEKYEEIRQLQAKEREIFKQVITSFARWVYDEKDPYTFGHMEEVEHLGIGIAEELGLKLDEKGKDRLAAALRLHDIGKMFVPDEILKKPGKLTPEEFELIKRHVIQGASILNRVDEFKEVANIIRHHHENYDGSGYPYGLKGEEIPMESRIIAVVDAFHAMVSDRPYRRSMSYDKAIEELRRNAGTQFDPNVVEAFIRSMDKQLKTSSAIPITPGSPARSRSAC